MGNPIPFILFSIVQIYVNIVKNSYIVVTPALPLQSKVWKEYTNICKPYAYLQSDDYSFPFFVILFIDRRDFTEPSLDKFFWLVQFFIDTFMISRKHKYHF